MDRFSRVLRRVDRRLEAPEPRRSRILMEMAGDLARALERTGGASAEVLWGGIRGALIPTVFGLVVLALCLLAWYGLRAALRRARAG